MILYVVTQRKKVINPIEEASSSFQKDNLILNNETE